MKIGLLSDTHGFLEEIIFSHFKLCDEIWHAGDIGDSVIERLAHFKPVRAVFGNIDGQSIRSIYPENLIFNCEGKKIFITHIAGSPPRYNPRVKKVIQEESPDVLICGHSHILKIMNDQTNNLLFINPGAAGRHGFHHIKTLVRFNITKGIISEMEVIELGKRGTL